LIGIYDPRLTQPIAEVLGALGGKAAYVVHGQDGLDELSTHGANRVSSLRDGRVETFELDAAQYGLRPATPEDLRGGGPPENAAILRAILAGEDRGPRRDVVILNAAAALATVHGNLENALGEARSALDSGAALQKLDRLIQTSQQVSA
jgi:anthranilate phosphoribosyltransferase